ncbi:Transient receptor potential cation channel subfamily M member 6 [Acropora cervicornis]|uniref:Transient receptor potential cation channel subfamily M member 6 n=1 Tax=Acropora cervicornis TaxID=6130 RepID=A0AAD9V2Q0_ACRCE|nr:Transient receptor potential cation channel subfamily M member 6 [Acropora cervicornis]
MGKSSHTIKYTWEEWVTIEEHIDEEFTKYVNKSGIPCGVDSDVRKKCESLAHFSHERSGENLMVVDMQGSVHSLFNPEIASKELVDGEEVLFSIGNLSLTAINNFIEHHTECSFYCTLLRR